MNDSELYAGFDEDGKRIVEDDYDEKQCWSHGTVQPPPIKMVEGGPVYILQTDVLEYIYGDDETDGNDDAHVDEDHFAVRRHQYA